MELPSHLQLLEGVEKHYVFKRHERGASKIRSGRTLDFGTQLVEVDFPASSPWCRSAQASRPPCQPSAPRSVRGRITNIKDSLLESSEFEPAVRTD